MSPIGDTPFLPLRPPMAERPPVAEPSAHSDAAWKMRQADAQIQAEAQRIQTAALRDGEYATAQVHYGRGADGQSYITSITVSRSGRESDAQANPRLEAGLADVSPARIPLSPDGLAQAFGMSASVADGLSEAEQSLLRQLQLADAGIRAHEALHFRAAGGIAAGVAQYEYMQGPDGQFYAVAGKVDVQTTATHDPEKAARDAQAMALAATAPADVSAQDMQVARAAYGKAAESYAKALHARSAVPESPAHNMIA